MIDSKKAIDAARKAARDFFRGEEILEISLEEVGRGAKGNWLITIGIVRPRPKLPKASSGPREVGFSLPYTRTYKQFFVGGGGEILAMKERKV